MQFGSITPYLGDAKDIVSGTAKPAVDKIRGYIQKASNTVTPTLYHKPSQLGKLAAASTAVYAATNANQDALAREYKCQTEGGFGLTAKEITEREYENKVFAFNSGVESRSGSIEELNKGYVQEGGVVTELNDIANCLYETHGVVPGSVATFSDKAYDVLSYDMERLVQVAPDLVGVVPEGIGMKILLMGAVGGITLASPYVREKAYKAGLLAKSGISSLVGKLRKPTKF